MDIFNTIILQWFMLLFNLKALLLQWKLSNAAVNVNAYQNLQAQTKVETWAVE